MSFILESSHRSDSGSGYWQLQLDRDLVDTISSIYPEWFKSNMAEGGGSPSAPRESPPKAVIDTSPILMDQNKECKGSSKYSQLFPYPGKKKVLLEIEKWFYCKNTFQKALRHIRQFVGLFCMFFLTDLFSTDF